MSDHNNDKYGTSTSSALLEQLVYIDTFMNNGTSSSAGDLTPNLDMDGQLSIDLAAFADDSFIFPDEDKPKNHNYDDEDDDMNQNHNNNHNGHSNHNNHENEVIFKNADDPLLNNTPLSIDSSSNNSPAIPNQHQVQKHILPSQDKGTGILGDVSKLPKFPVPPGAKSSLVSAGLSQNQIDLLSALIAQHQTSLGNSIPGQSKNHQQQISHTPHQQEQSSFGASLASQNFASYSPVRQHSQLYGMEDRNPFPSHHSRGSTSSAYNNLGSPTSSTVQTSPNGFSIKTPNSSEDTISNMGTSSSLSSYNNIDGTVTPSATNGHAELDKRRRNTAASARFRIKKKLKEKQMENKIFSLNELIKEFEVKIQQLEMENKLLRNLIIEKGSQKSDNELKLLRERAKLN
ncbi:uncharacterized protein RJT20DRAFT_15602 [Scheffersomyces xylosifermentans]|uniref:uncharacterized protein n=1 Tax=Scheffersomyces xylosifermentans TaxID=1304137 RepID=UPI00315D2F6A